METLSWIRNYSKDFNSWLNEIHNFLYNKVKKKNSLNNSIKTLYNYSELRALMIQFSQDVRRNYRIIPESWWYTFLWIDTQVYVDNQIYIIPNPS